MLKRKNLLEALITSKTRVKLLVKFFLNPSMQSYLRELSNEFGESTNGIRLELNRLTDAGLLETEKGKGNTIMYKAQKTHPLFNEISKMVAKYTGVNDLLSIVLESIGDLKKAYLVGDYSKGIDGGVIEIVLVGKIKVHYLEALIIKLKEETNREVKYHVFKSEKVMDSTKFDHKMLIFAA